MCRSSMPVPGTQLKQAEPMQILIVLIPISIVLIGIAAAMFLWAVDNDQFEQLDLHAFDILQDDPTDDSGESP